MPRASWLPALAVGAAIAHAAACAGEGGTAGAGRVEAHDSAGVTIVVNHGAGVWGSEAWTVEPELELGGDEATPGGVFGRIADVDVDGAGRMYVLDQLAREIRVFEANGGLVRRMGGPGEGPGEFGRFVNGVIVVDGRVLVPDWTLGRLTTFDTSGVVVSTEALPVAGVRSWWLRDGDGLAGRLLRRVTDEEGRWRGEDVLVRWAASGTAPDTLLTLTYPESDLGGPSAARVPLVVNTPFWTTLEDGGVAWSTLAWPELRIHDASGALRQVVRRDAWRARPVDDAVHGVLVEKLGEKLALLGANPDVVATLDIVASTELPVLASILRGPAGTLWVQRTGSPEAFDAMAINAPESAHGFGGAEWDVLDADGRYQGTVTLPSAMRVTRVVGDRLYGIARDSLDVERVVRARIIRP